jgi:REP element-mobilizing transposase RayT
MQKKGSIKCHKLEKHRSVSQILLSTTALDAVYVKPSSAVKRYIGQAIIVIINKTRKGNKKMTQARQTIISLGDTPFYHLMGRCVRSGFLCGEDRVTGKSYEHRKQWIVDRLKELSFVYTIDICAYAVMSNNYHLVIKVNKEKALKLSDEEVIDRWTKLFNGNVLVQRYQKGECHTEAERETVKEIIAQWRERLYDISWFMRCLNEHISRKANEEDKCRGHFWEGRFKSQALLNEQALLSCMAYVDLNPIRADMANTLEESEFTSIEQRIKEVKLDVNNSQLDTKDETTIEDSKKKIRLADFVGSKERDGIAYTLIDYLELVDWTGRSIRDDKRGYIDKTEPKIISKLGFTSDIWFKSMNQFSEHSYSHIGTDDQLRAVCNESGKKWKAGAKLSRELYQ